MLQITHVFLLNCFVLRFYHFKVIFIVLRLLTESLSEILSFLLVRSNSMLLIDLRVVLHLHELILEGSLFNKEKFSFILDILFRLLYLMLVLEVVLGDGITFGFSLGQSLFESFNTLNEVLFL